MNYKEAFELVRREFPGARISTEGFETDEVFVLPPDDFECEGLPPYLVWKKTGDVEKSFVMDRRFHEWRDILLQNPVSV